MANISTTKIIQKFLEDSTAEKWVEILILVGISENLRMAPDDLDELLSSFSPRYRQMAIRRMVDENLIEPVKEGVRIDYRLRENGRKKLYGFYQSIAKWGK